MSIGPISAAGIAPISTAGLSTSATAGAGATSLTGSSGFGNAATDLIDGLQNQQNSADSLALAASTGGGNVGDVMIAATQASLSTSMTVAVRNKAVEAFNQIMGMQF
jgi:flagellar hook-basal body complex protein FliE